jgi:hypothetical protein
VLLWCCLLLLLWCAADVFLTLDDLLNLNPEFRPLRALYAKAGLEDEVLDMKGQYNTLTVFAPTGTAHRSRAGCVSNTYGTAGTVPDVSSFLFAWHMPVVPLSLPYLPFIPVLYLQRRLSSQQKLRCRASARQSCRMC